MIQTWVNGDPAAAVFDALTPDGHIGLQVHASPEGQGGLEVRFRNLRVGELLGEVGP